MYSELPTVFVVDGDACLCRDLARLLRSTGYQAVMFASAEDFLAWACFEVFGCVLMEVRLPGLNGLALQQTLVAAGCQLPIVFISSHGDIPTCVRAMKAGAVDFLPKPLKNEELLEAVAQALAKSQREYHERTAVDEIRGRLSTLTPREHEVLRHVIAGQLNKQIAGYLGTVEKTIKVHRARVMEKMDARSLPELVTMVARVGINAPLHLEHKFRRHTPYRFRAVGTDSLL